MPRVTLTLWRTLLLGVAAFLAWKIVAYGLAAHYVERLAGGDADALSQVQTWQPNHPEALYTQALRDGAEDPDSALGLLSRAYVANPTDPRPLLAVAELYLNAGRVDDADALVRIADRLNPVNPAIQQQIALYWDQRDDTPTALQHFSTAMAAHPNYRRQGLPVMLRLAEDPGLRALLEPIALADPPWWSRFFVYAASRAENTDVVRFLMELRRREDPDDLTEQERIAFQSRLLRDGFASEAYLAWLSTLEPAARKQLGLLFDGGFELPLSNEPGFGWRAQPHKQLEIRALRTLGSRGSKSLMVRFNNFDQRFQHLSQRLFLQPGTYRLTGSARVDGLKTAGGVRWRISCVGERKALLGESEVFLGRADWRDFAIDFEVPGTDCTTQDLRLVSAGKHAFELDMDGLLWFDDLRILRILRTGGVDTAARADDDQGKR